MMKFFRKYTKQLLAVFMALLLIVWLGGSALTELLHGDPTGGKSVQGTAYGATVRLRDMWPAFHETETLEEIGLKLWQAPWAMILYEWGMDPQQTAGRVRRLPLSKEEWYMLEEAAMRSHVAVQPDEVENFKTREGLTPEVLAQIRQHSRKTMEEVDEAIKGFLRVQEAAMMAAQSIKLSEADINELVRQTGEKARVVAVVLETKTFLDNSYQPTPQEIQAQFERLKDTASRPGEPGYEQPQTARIEFIQVVADALEKTQKLDEQEAYTYWKQNSGDFKKPTSQPTTSSAPAKEMPYTSFSEARPKVIAKLQKEKAATEAQRIAHEIISTLEAPWMKVTTTQPDEAKTAPDSEKAADLYPKLVEQLQSKYPGALKYKQLDFLEERQLTTQPAGKADALANSQQHTTLAEAAFLVPELEKRAGEARTQRFYRGLYETAPEPFVASNGDVYIIRTIAVHPKHAPTTQDAVHDQIVQDIRNQRAFEAAQKAAQKFADEASQKGVEAAWNADATLKQKLGPEAFKHPEPFPQKIQFGFGGAPQLFSSGMLGMGLGEANEQIFALAGKTTTQPNRVTMVEDKRQKRFVVAQLLEILPVTREEYKKQRASAMQMLEMEHRMGALQQWFDPEQIRARVDWVAAPKPKPTDTGDDGKS